MWHNAKIKRQRAARTRRPLLEQLEARTVLAGEIMGISVVALAPGTDTPITTVLAGHDFDLQVLVQDLRNDGNPSRGVFAAYTDLLYDKSLAKVRVAEVQSLSFSSPFTGSFTLTLNPGQTTAPIPYNVGTGGGRVALVGAMQSALDATLGPNTVLVSQGAVAGKYDIRFVGQPDVDEPLLQAKDSVTQQPMPNIAITETVKGNPTLAASFTEAFRSRYIGLNDGLPSPFQNGLTAIDAADRVDELGATLGTEIIGNEQVELVRARFKASLPASQNSAPMAFTPDVSQIESPIHDNLLLADITKDPPERSYVPPDQILLTAANLTIVRAVVAGPGTAALDEDTAAGVIVPVIPLVNKDANAPPGAIELRSFTQPVTGGSVVRYDPNNTPADLTDDRVRFIPAPDFNGTTTFTYTAGIVGDNSPSDESTGTITVTVNPVNDPPVNGVPSGQTVAEDGTLVFSAANSNALSITDIDADPAGVEVILAAANGTLTLGGTTGLVFFDGSTGTNDATMRFRGTTSSINAALNGLAFKPAADFNGPTNITITTSDLGNTGKVVGVALTDQDTVAINVTPVNDPPVVTAPATQNVFTVNTLAFSPAFGNAITVADVDAGSDALTTTVTASAGIGTLSATALGGAQITGNGSTSLTITGSQTAITATLGTLLLTPQGVASGSIAVVANDQGHNPAPPQIGQSTIQINVVLPPLPFAVNDAPAGLLEGSATYSLNVLANDLANGTGKPTLVSFSQPSIGTIELDDNGTPGDATDDKLVYRPPLKNGQPDLDFFTPDGLPPITFTYTINESPSTAAPNSTATVSLRIANVADAPVANNDGLNNSYGTSVGVALTRNAAQGLLANDITVDNNYGNANIAALTVLGATVGVPVLINTAGGGVATVNVDGSFTYTPAALFSGNDTFNYQAHSSLGLDSTPATVTIHVSAPPIANDDSFATAQEDQTFISLTSVVANDQDPTDGETLSAELLTNVPPAAGSVTLSANGFFTFTPTANFNTTRPPASPITFTYRATAPSGRVSAPATVSITVNEVNDNPTATSDTFDAIVRQGSLGVDQPVSVLGNDIIAPDVQETLSVIALNGVNADASGNTPAIPTSGNGSVRLVGFQIKYTSPTLTGDDSFSYTISDGRGGTSTANVQVTILPAYDYGDAPDSYGTLLASNGARHAATGPQLGLLRDVEANATPTPGANGDDLADTDDEDGLVASSLARGKNSSISVQVTNAAAGAKLDAWIDFDHNGIFDAVEKVSNSLAVTNGTAVVPFVVPADAQIGPAFVRLRISTAGGLGPTGIAADGEVEDHLVTILQDLNVTLPTGNGSDRISIRQNGANIEVFDLNASSVIASSPLALTTSVIVQGSATETDEMTVDYAFGGFFVLPNGIQIDGGASGGDLAIIQGATGGTTSVHYTAGGATLGNATLQTVDSALQNNVQIANFEPLTISGVAAFDVTGTLNVGADTLTVMASSPVALGALTNLGGGTINATGGVNLAASQTLTGTGAVTGPISAAAGSTISATGNLSLGDVTSAAGFSTLGTLNVGANIVNLFASSAVSLSGQTNIAGGTLNSPNGVSLAATATLTGSGSVSSAISAAAGSIIEATGALSLGSAAAAAGFVSQGELRTNGNTVTLLDSGQVTLGSLTTLGSGAAPGTLVAANGAILTAGRSITGFGTISTPNNATLPLTVNGSVQGTSAAQGITLAGYVIGVGSLTNVKLSGTINPGFVNPTATITGGGVTFDAASKTVIELAGSALGSFDVLDLTGAASLNGSLQVSLLNGFVPAIGQSFLVLASSALTGSFANTTLPTLPGDRNWKTTQTASGLTFSVVAGFPWHNSVHQLDVSGDNVVVAGDALAIINYINAFGGGPVPASAYTNPPGTPFGFIDTTGGPGNSGDNFVAPADALAVINYINAFGPGLAGPDGESSGPSSSGGEGESAPAADLGLAAVLPTLSRQPSIDQTSLAELIALLAADTAENSPRRRR